MAGAEPVYLHVNTREVVLNSGPLHRLLLSSREREREGVEANKQISSLSRRNAVVYMYIHTVRSISLSLDPLIFFFTEGEAAERQVRRAAPFTTFSRGPRASADLGLMNYSAPAGFRVQRRGNKCWVELFNEFFGPRSGRKKFCRRCCSGRGNNSS